MRQVSAYFGCGFVFPTSLPKKSQPKTAFECDAHMPLFIFIGGIFIDLVAKLLKGNWLLVREEGDTILLLGRHLRVSGIAKPKKNVGKLRQASRGIDAINCINMQVKMLYFIV